MKLTKENMDEWKKEVGDIFSLHGWAEYLSDCGLNDDEIFDMAEGDTPEEYFYEELDNSR